MENKGLVKKVLATLCTAGVIAGIGFVGVKGCDYVGKKMQEQKTKPQNSHAYDYRGFIGNDYVIYESPPFSNRNCVLLVARPDKSEIIYHVGNDLRVTSIFVYKDDNLESKMDFESKEGDIWANRQLQTQKQIELDTYLAEIYKRKYKR
jgi:hypothetical protein